MFIPIKLTKNNLIKVSLIALLAFSKKKPKLIRFIKVRLIKFFYIKLNSRIIIIMLRNFIHLMALTPLKMTCLRRLFSIFFNLFILILIFFLNFSLQISTNLIYLRHFLRVICSLLLLLFNHLVIKDVLFTIKNNKLLI